MFAPCTLDLGPLETTSTADAVRVLVDSLSHVLGDQNVERVVCEAQLVDHFNSKRQLISARLFEVQGAVRALCLLYSVELKMVTPMAVKREYWPVWRTGNSHAENKRLAIEKCSELYGDHYSSYSDHACDAKLLAMYPRG